MGEILAVFCETGAWDHAPETTKPAQLPWQAPIEQSALLLRAIPMTYAAYRMQLFLYAKQSGNAELGTFECWVGEPPPAG